MGFTFQIDDDHRSILVRFAGRPSVAELGECRAKLESDDAFNPNYGILLDLVGVDMTGISPEELRERARRVPNTSRLAIVAERGFPFGMARMYELAGYGTRRAPVAVFCTRDEALRWLQHGGDDEAV